MGCNRKWRMILRLCAGGEWKGDRNEVKTVPFCMSIQEKSLINVLGNK